MGNISSSDYKPNSYWNELLDRKFDYAAVSHPFQSNTFNRWAYRERLDAFQRVLKGLNLRSLKGHRILDVGSGVGFWVDFLKKQGATNITGIDISKESIKVLSSRYPNFNFKLLNISDKDACKKLSNKFDLITVMDVLLHIVDEREFSQALVNLTSLAADNGLIILMEPVIVKNQYEFYGHGQHSRARHLSMYKNLLISNGFEIVEIRSVSFLLNNPIEARTKIGYLVLKKCWLMICRLDSGSNLRGNIVGFTLYWIDRILLKVFTLGPTSKIIVGRKVGG